VTPSGAASMLSLVKPDVDMLIVRIIAPSVGGENGERMEGLGQSSRYSK